MKLDRSLPTPCQSGSKSKGGDGNRKTTRSEERMLAAVPVTSPLLSPPPQLHPYYKARPTPAPSPIPGSSPPLHLSSCAGAFTCKLDRACNSQSTTHHLPGNTVSHQRHAVTVCWRLAPFPSLAPFLTHLHRL